MRASPTAAGPVLCDVRMEHATTGAGREGAATSRQNAPGLGLAFRRTAVGATSRSRRGGPSTRCRLAAPPDAEPAVEGLREDELSAFFDRRSEDVRGQWVRAASAL